MFAMSTLHDWVPDPGSITCWHPSAAASLNARHAPVSPVPPSYQQTQHLRRYCDHAARGLEMTRM
ncbi:MAG: acyltransferase, partial [Mycobacterium sp.]